VRAAGAMNLCCCPVAFVLAIHRFIAVPRSELAYPLYPVVPRHLTSELCVLFQHRAAVMQTPNEQAKRARLEDRLRCVRSSTTASPGLRVMQLLPNPQTTLSYTFQLQPVQIAFIPFSGYVSFPPYRLQVASKVEPIVSLALVTLTILRLLKYT
jgi:hypothetical protein